MLKIAIILGTRPEIIKMSPVIRELKNNAVEFFILHTGQHYSYELDQVFIEQLELPNPEYNLKTGSGTHAESTGKMLIGIEEVLLKEKPNIVLVEGDTNSVLAGALTSVKLHIPVAHVESGLRSNDRTMPEEINRILTDHISEILFAPTNVSRDNLIQENIPAEKIFITGNPIVDAVFQNLRIANKKIDILKELGLKPKEYFLMSCHRQENVDVEERLKGILKSSLKIFERYKIPILYPIHPRTKKMVEFFGLNIPQGVRPLDPFGYLEFLLLEKNARMIFTDSGGVQEEACILNVPCVTLRDNTERPETLVVGSNILAGTQTDQIMKKSSEMFKKKNKWTNPYGKEGVSERIVQIIKNY